MIYNVPGMPHASLDQSAESALYLRDLLRAFVLTGEMNAWEDALLRFDLLSEQMAMVKKTLEEAKNA